MTLVKISDKNLDVITHTAAIAFLGAIFSLTVYQLLSQKGIFSFWAYGDAQMLNAGIHFARDGFFQNHFLPMTSPGLSHSLIENNGPNGRYFHYPALHALLVGIIVKMIDLFRGHTATPVEEIKNFAQSFFALISLTSLYLNFLLLKKITSRVLSLFGLVAITTSGFFTNFGISLCDQPLHYFFLSLNLLLISKILNQTHKNLFSNTRLNLSIGTVIFLAARNSIETPIVIFVLNSTAIIILGCKTSSTYVKWIFKFLLMPIFFAMTIQFVQARLEFQSFAEFFNHWTKLSTTRFPLAEVGDFNLILQFIKMLKPQTISLLVSVSVLLIVQQKRRFKDSQSGGTLVISAYIWGLITLVLLIPRQMFYMSDYATYYFNHALILSVVVLLHRTSKFRYTLITAALLIEVTTLLFSGMSSIAVKNAPKFLESQSIFDAKSQRWWGGTASSWKQISLLGPLAISNISRTTNSDDIIVLPDEFTGNSAGESNVVLEFYLQRHAITVADNSVILCRDLNKKVPGISGIYKFDETLSIYAHEQC